MSFHTTVIAGSGLQLKCDIRDAERVLWTRNGKVLNAELSSQFTVIINNLFMIFETLI